MLPVEKENVNQFEVLLMTTPHVLFSGEELVEEEALRILPFSAGIEIECDKKAKFDIQYFRDIAGIMDVNVDFGEQRYRIPPGLIGLKCLYRICEGLKEYSLFNPLSGIHIHVDMTNSFYHITDAGIERNKEWILAELDTWNYDIANPFNSRTIGYGYNWIRLQPNLKTAEFRTCEMLFDYAPLIKRISHAQDIIRRFNVDIGFDAEIFELEQIMKFKFEPEIEESEIERIVRSRKIRL